MAIFAVQQSQVSLFRAGKKPEEAYSKLLKLIEEYKDDKTRQYFLKAELIIVCEQGMRYEEGHELSV